MKIFNFEDIPPNPAVAYNTEMVSNTFTAIALSASITGIETHRHLGEKRYEIKDHLGNVRAVVSDIKNAEDYSVSASSWKFLADVRSMSNYYPYGMEIEAGSWSGGDYNYGYNGMLKEGIGKDVYNTHFRNLSGEDGRWWSPDPLEAKFPSVSPYATMGNNPIYLKDINGDAPTTFYFTEYSAGLGIMAPYLDYYHQNGTAYDDIGVTFFTTSKSNDIVEHHTKYAVKGMFGDIILGGDLSAGIGGQYVNKNTFYESIKITATNIPTSIDLKSFVGISFSISFKEDSWWPESLGGSIGVGIGAKVSSIESELNYAVSFTSKESKKLKGLGLINTTYTIEKIKILDGASGKEQEVHRLFGFETKGGKLTKVDTGINLIKEENKLENNKIQEIYKSEDYIKQEKVINE